MISSVLGDQAESTYLCDVLTDWLLDASKRLIVSAKFIRVMSTSSRLYSIVFNKCPQCHEGDFFVTNSAFSRHFDRMHDRCPHCGQNFMPEPGFYWASMFVSYALFTVWILATFFLVVIWFEVDLDYYLFGLVPTLFLLTPYFFRMARRTWLSIFVSPNSQQVSVVQKK